MKTILRAEEVAMTIFSLYFLTRYNLELPIWVWLLLFFLPGIAMLGYLKNAMVGAFFYNLFHHKGIAIMVIGVGFMAFNEITIAAGILLFAHASFDRIWGYGLKYNDGFKHTHLGALK